MTSGSMQEQPSGSGARRVDLESVLLMGGMVLFLVLLYEMHVGSTTGSFLSPPLVAAAGLILLWPIRQQPATRSMLIAGLFLVLMWFVVRLSGVLLPFLVVYLFAFLFDPLVARLEQRRGIRRWISSLLLTLIVVAVFTAILFLLIPNIIGQVETLAASLLASMGSIQNWLETSRLLQSIENAGIATRAEISQQVSGILQQQASKVVGGIPSLFQNLVGYAGSLLGLLTSMVIFPVVLYYTLKDYPHIKRRLVDLFPTFRGNRDYLVEAGGLVGNYLRGQIIISAIGAINVGVILFLFNVPFALLIGVLTGLLNMIPNIGALITNVIGILLALIFGDPPLVDAMIVFLALLGQSILETTILTPKIMSARVGLHPVLIILSLFVFGSFLGIFGLLIAVPATALLMTLYKNHRTQLTFELRRPTPF